MSTTDNNRFKDTLNLPTTDFPIRPDTKELTKKILAEWQTDDVYARSYENPENKETYVLHDGPPYANGHIHMGTAFNKVFKDLVCKYKRMSGYFVPYRPGWDCHGLPIELKAVAEYKEHHPTAQTIVDPIAVMEICRKTAMSWFHVQRDEFKELGVIAAWDHPYMTMAPDYEAEIVRAFGIFSEKGYITRKYKTVPWCATCKTALATVEIEHHERKDPSCYILFRLNNDAVETVCAPVLQQFPGLEINVLVWTTTPWTIPLNRAVVLNPKAKYVLLQSADPARAFFVARERADAICALLGIEKNIVFEVDAQALANHHVHHPLIDEFTVPILLSDIVTLNDGTACMHMAPGCGPEDYQLAVQQGIEIYSPIAEDGTYTQEIIPAALAGMSVIDGQIWVMRELGAKNRLLFKTSIRHSYPHCWRCRNGLIFRATKQWFCDLQKNDLISRSIHAAQSMDFVPETGRTRLISTIKDRTEWCISRQRIWGTPIVALLCTNCDTAVLDIQFINNVANGIAREGIEFWQRLTIDEIINNNMLASSLRCSSCETSDPAHFTKEHDILDVWFDSGISHSAVLARDPELRVPADVYLEGSDQHRGWFQSSLLTSMVLHDKSCSKGIVTHGYVVDAKGHKMSKSLGNVIAPREVINEFSPDVLRLWVASVDATNDMVISTPLLKNVAEVYRRIRNTARFLLSNLYDFDITRDAVSLDKMLAIDQYALARLHEIDKIVRDAYESFEIPAVYQTLGTYCAVDLSAFVLDVMKDRLYVERADGRARRSAQTACYYILDTLTRLMAPILSFLAEEISAHYQKDKTRSIHLQEFIETVNVWEVISKDAKRIDYLPLQENEPVENIPFTIAIQGQWNALLELRDVVLKALEMLRAQDIIRHSLEARVELSIDMHHPEGFAVRKFLRNLQAPETSEQFLKELFIVSQVVESPGAENLAGTAVPWVHVRVTHAEGVKCPRCWNWDVSEHPESLCRRCVRVLGL